MLASMRLEFADVEAFAGLRPSSGVKDTTLCKVLGVQSMMMLLYVLSMKNCCTFGTNTTQGAIVLRHMR